jgi:hypothetical protein
MSEVVEIKTGTEVSEVVDQLVKTMGDETLCLPVPKSVAEGEWVRFSVQLEDGTHVIEGVGRCAGAIPRGNPTDRYELHLAELSFDERNEIMYERMLIAKDAAKQGDDTGAIKLEEFAMEVIEGKDEVTESSPPARSVPPPPPGESAATEADAKKAKPKAEAKKPKPKASALPPKSDVSKPSLMKSPLGKKSTPPPKRASTPPAKRTSTPPKSKSAQSDATKVDIEAPKKARASVRPSHRPVAVSDGPFTLEVPYELVAKARKLEDRLPRKLFDRDRTPKKPEAAVLLTAIRVGLGALEGAADDD